MQKDRWLENSSYDNKLFQLLIMRIVTNLLIGGHAIPGTF